MSDNKYKIFRNFMVNELKITREDIKEWTMQAVNESVEKILRGMSIEDLVRDSVHRIITQNVNAFSFAQDITEKIAGDMLRKKLDISVKLKEDTNAVEKP